MKSGGGLGRASGKKHADIKSVLYLRCLRHIQALTKTALFVNVLVLDWSWSLSGGESKNNVQNDAIPILKKYPKKRSIRAQDGPQHGSRLFQKSTCFPVRSFRVPTSGDWRAVPNPTGHENPTKMGPQIMTKSINKLKKMTTPDPHCCAEHPAGIPVGIPAAHYPPPPYSP